MNISPENSTPSYLGLVVSGDNAMLLSAPGRPTVWIVIGQGPTGLAAGAKLGFFGFSAVLFLPFSLSV